MDIKLEEFSDRLIRETWTGEEKGGLSSELSALKPKMAVTRYMQKLEQHIRQALDQAGINEQKAHDANKARYDKRSTVRTLQVGDKVLVLMPTTSHSLTASWDGPFEVMECLKNNNYVIAKDGRRAKFHINALRKYEHSDGDHYVIPECNNAQNHTVTIPVVLSGDLDAQTEALTGANDLPTATRDTVYAVGEQLTREQRAQIDHLVRSYPCLLYTSPSPRD